MLIDRQVVEDFRREANEETKKIAEKYDLTLKKSSCSYNEETINMKFTIENATINVAKLEFKRHCIRYGLKPEDYGKNFTSATGESITIIGVNTRAKKYPIIAISNNGTSTRFTSEYVRKNL